MNKNEYHGDIHGEQKKVEKKKMSGVNKCILLGNLGGDPETRYTPGGQAVTNFRIATSENWTDKDGKKQQRTEWHRIVAWGKLAEVTGQYLQKGSQAYVEGRVQTRKWQDKDGTDRYTTEIVAQTVQFLGRPKGKGQEEVQVEETLGEQVTAGLDAPF